MRLKDKIAARRAEKRERPTLEAVRPGKAAKASKTRRAAPPATVRDEPPRQMFEDSDTEDASSPRATAPKVAWNDMDEADVVDDYSDVDDDVDDEDVDGDGLLPIERQSRKLDAAQRAEAEASAAELRSTARDSERFRLPTHSEREQEEGNALPPAMIKERIEKVLEVLAEFKDRREPGRPRAEYIEQLSR